jgi:hypothetical protein
MKGTDFWDITSCCPLQVNRRFRGTYRLHFHLLSHWFLSWLILRTWRWGRHVSPKRRLAFNGLHGVISQKIVLFIATALRTSNPASCCNEFRDCSCLKISGSIHYSFWQIRNLKSCPITCILGNSFRTVMTRIFSRLRITAFIIIIFPRIFIV